MSMPMLNELSTNTTRKPRRRTLLSFFSVLFFMCDAVCVIDRKKRWGQKVTPEGFCLLDAIRNCSNVNPWSIDWLIDWLFDRIFIIKIKIF